MSGRKMPNFPASASQCFSSTPVKTIQGKYLNISKGLDDDVLSDEEDTFSLLSPIYHDSFDSDEDLEPSPRASPRLSDSSRLSLSPVRCELPRTPSVQMLDTAVEPLSAWEKWLVSKAKEDRLHLEKQADEEWLKKEKKAHEERELEQKKIVMEERIQIWLKMKREQEKQEQLLKLRKEEEDIQRQHEKQTEIEQKAQQKYKDWLQKKNQEKIEMEKKEKEEAALKEEQEKERRQRAEEKFKDWLAKANEKTKASPQSPCYTRSPYEKYLPSPGFYNPIPWKPIHVPPVEKELNNTSGKKPQKQQRSQQSSASALRLRNSASATQVLQRR
ncbi:coiled-coil domain-containing protein 34 [Pseudochaenichthys georgianus]|uniref:coiled-coil domain-containing protein 34 n=1 Tax=Pseudochaenichthys georgianus TaxID=52239 RepID=UPI00146B97E7|nr:coiled-coil domain-containing protein 34 [Pseudochaenichthys georgianus]